MIRRTQTGWTGPADIVMTTPSLPLLLDHQAEPTPLRQLLPNAVLEAARTLDLPAENTELLLAAAQSEVDVLAPTSNSALEVTGPGYAVVIPPRPGDFRPRVVQFKLSPLIACICGAVGTVVGGLTPIGWAMIGAVAAIGLRDFWSKKVMFEAEHGQVLFEMFRSSDGGKGHDIPREHLLSNIQHARAEAGLAPMERATFDTTVSTLLATGALTRGGGSDTLRWTELAMEFEL